MSVEADSAVSASPRAKPDRPLKGGRVLVWRHPIWVRFGHWVNVLAVTVLLMSGINILMAHPALYWGLRSTFADPWLALPTAPDWMMIPQGRDLGQARHWHFTFAWLFVINGLIYLGLLVATRRLARRLWPTKADIADIPHSVVEHAQLKFPHDDRARVYNVLQKLTYLAMILVVLPIMLVTGLAMSPMMNAAMPWLLDLLGGRQSARTLHFLSASAIVGFIIIHVALVVWTGLFNNIRSMITGWFAIKPSEKAK